MQCQADESGYCKATIRSRNLDFMLEQGWSRTVDWLEPEAEAFEPATTDPDKGDGEPGSMEWHQNAIASLEDKDSVVEYVTGVCGETVSKHGNLDTVKAKALEAIEASKQE